MKSSHSQKANFFLYEAKTKNGLKFDPNNDIWKFKDISKTYHFDFNTLPLVKENIYGLKRLMVWYLENHSLTHTSNMFRNLKWLLAYIDKDSANKITLITAIDLINYHSTLDSSHEWYLGALSGFLKKWYKMGFPGLSEDGYNYLNEATFKGNEKGKAVLTMDPYNGPFTDLELEQIQSAINNSYANNEITKDDFILVWLFMIYGSRPIQFAQLKICDLIAAKRKDNTKEYIIRIPRAKNRQEARSEFKERIIPPALGKVIFDYREKIRQEFIGTLDNPEDAPFFPSMQEGQLGKLAYHQSSVEINYKLQKVLNSLHLISERTGEQIHITSTRFRRTIGTRAAAEGHGELIIAEILDHTDTQNAGVYVQSSPEIIKRIDRAIALQMAPIAQAFAGVLIRDKSKAKRADDPTSDIIDPNIDSECKAMGKCGSYEFCGLLSPLACYTCSSFQAWDDGPHEQLLMHLLRERERLIETTDYRIASINDQTILAVAQVVEECNRVKTQNTLELSQ